MFITFEGVEGSGKSTQAKLLAELLIKMGHKATLTREPGWGKLGELIRRAILDERDLDLDPFSELCLFCADRAQHVRDFIKPRLQEGEIVICDRYFDSTVVYQGFGRKLEKRLVNRIARASTLDLIPDVTFLLNLPVRAGLSRLQTRGEITKMDEEPLEFHEMIRQGYMLIAKREPGRIRKINADREILEIHEEIKNIVLESISL
ncbi:MAG: dTMP kinase [Candidatus Dadabacteria bacterium]|nr:dTMP kinase [Candidatus Dadabacteria bacterium]TDI88679.1 MAG: dTMP kinase [Candidatus Dadabacteria bacterium]TDJ00972.1 MAG: dTMP kinase [Candidatus Dadabacteria bacterium]